MKTQKCISILSLAVSGLLIGSSQALASPLLDSDLASFTVLGASSERYIPNIGVEGAGGRMARVQAISAMNASPESTGVAKPINTTPQGVGAAVMQLAQALHSVGMDIPGMARRSASQEPVAKAVAETAILPQAPSSDKRELARRYLCAMAEANKPVAAFDADLCKDISKDSLLTPGRMADSSWDSKIPAVSNRNTDQIVEVRQQTLLQATLPVDVDLKSDIATSLAAFPSDELAVALPEPETLGLMALGLAGIGFSRKRTA